MIWDLEFQMRTVRRVIGSFVFLFMAVSTYSNAADETILYVYPMPDSKNVSRHTSILLRPDPSSDFVNVPSSLLFQVKGSKNGEYAGNVNYSDDRKTLVFKPEFPFAPGEVVTVMIKPTGYSFSFQIKKRELKRSADLHCTDFAGTSNTQKEVGKAETYGKITTINGVTVPSDFPVIDVSVNSVRTAPGNLFFGFRKSYFIIMDRQGTPLFYEKSNDFLMDFKLQPGGVLSRTVDDWDKGEGFYVLMDQNFNYIDTIRAQHGYGMNHHEYQLLPNGHSLFIVNDHVQVDMSAIVEGGKANATVLGNHVQELDSNKNVVFEWRSWDHFSIEDAVYENLTADFIDYVHMNSVAVDYDGHYVLSSRNLSECTKINSTTGEIIWRLGGVNNQFDFINDGWQNSYQHFIRPVPGKENYYTMFDNGTHRDQKFSRAVEFKLDTTNWTAIKVWEYRSDPDLFAAWLGSTQRLSNGNTLICWGGGSLPFATEVTLNKQVVYEAGSAGHIAVYRTQLFDWMGVADRPNLIIESSGAGIALIFNKFGDKDLEYYKIYSGKNPENLTLLDTSHVSFYTYDNPENLTDYYFHVTAVDSRGGGEHAFSHKAYFYEFPGAG
jgi:hypothetical protein